MTLLEALNNPIFDLPIENTEFFPEYLNLKFNIYLDLLSRIDDEYKDVIASSLENIKRNCRSFESVLNNVFIGNTAKAYQIFKIEIDKLHDFLVKKDKNAQDEIPNNLFRARLDQKKRLNIKDMFHVPFEKRYRIPTSRFGLPGLPCLYLCNTIYTCWEEMGRPDFAHMPVSRFEVTGTVFNFLDMRPFNSHLKGILELQVTELYDYVRTLLLPTFLNTYPLFIACYAVEADKDSVFKPEYIFPQMLMQWVGQHEFLDGIKYISTKCKPAPSSFLNPKPFVNYAVPVKTLAESGFCQVLKKHFKLTEPLTWELFSILYPSKASSDIDFEMVTSKYPTEIINISLIEDKKDWYHKTQFGILESELFNMPLKQIIDM